MSKVSLKRFAISLSLIPLVSGCDDKPPSSEELVGIWRAENGSQLELSADGSLRAYQLGLGCWDHPHEPFPRRAFSGEGTWSISHFGDPSSIGLHVVDDHPVSTYILFDRGVFLFFDRADELLCVIGDPDSGEYVSYLKQRAGHQ